MIPLRLTVHLISAPVAQPSEDDDPVEGQQHRGFSGNGCPYPAPWATLILGELGGTVQNQAWKCRVSLGDYDPPCWSVCESGHFRELRWEYSTILGMRSLGASGRGSLGVPHAALRAMNPLDKWVCLKMVSTPNPIGFADHYPVFKWLAIIGNINPTFSDKPKWSSCLLHLFVFPDQIRSSKAAIGSPTTISGTSSSP